VTHTARTAHSCTVSSYDSRGASLPPYETHTNFIHAHLKTVCSAMEMESKARRVFAVLILNGSICEALKSSLVTRCVRA